VLYGAYGFRLWERAFGHLPDWVEGYVVRIGDEGLGASDTE
jgi:hypothetical protein